MVFLNYRTLLPTMTDSLLAPGREVLYMRYHTGELSVLKVPEPDRVAISARAKNNKGPKPGEHVQLFCMKGHATLHPCPPANE